MRILILLSLLVSFNAMADSASCYSEDGQVDIFVVAGGGEVSFLDLNKEIYFEDLNETLPKGRYELEKDINEEIGYYFQEYAWIDLRPTSNAGEAILTINGQDDSAPWYTFYERKLKCYGDAF